MVGGLGPLHIAGLAEFSIPKESPVWLKVGIVINMMRCIIHQYPMHIKTANIEGEYKCIIVGHYNPVRVDMREGYGSIYGPSFFTATFCVDSVYPSFDCGRS